MLCVFCIHYIPDTFQCNIFIILSTLTESDPTNMAYNLFQFWMPPAMTLLSASIAYVKILGMVYGLMHKNRGTARHGTIPMSKTAWTKSVTNVAKLQILHLIHRQRAECLCSGCPYAFLNLVNNIQPRNVTRFPHLTDTASCDLFDVNQSECNRSKPASRGSHQTDKYSGFSCSYILLVKLTFEMSTIHVQQPSFWTEEWMLFRNSVCFEAVVSHRMQVLGPQPPDSCRML